MGQLTHIAWCDHTANFWEGCTKVSPGCLHCYAEARDKRHMMEAVDHWGPGAPRRKSKSAIKDCLRWNKDAEICQRGYEAAKEAGKWAVEMCASYGLTKPRRPRVFSLSLGDWLDPEVPIDWFADMLDTIRLCPHLDFLLCTKRPELALSRIRAARNYHTTRNAELALWLHNWLPHPATPGMPATPGTPPKNIWLLASAENQTELNRRAPDLLKLPAVIHGLSCEPLLGPLDLTQVTYTDAEEPDNVLECDYNILSGEHWVTNSASPSAYEAEAPKIDWVIVGGESGRGARPCNINWIRGIKNQCDVAGVACFVKQLGSNAITTDENPLPEEQFDADGTSHWFTLDFIKHPKGGDPNEWPVNLRVRQFPSVK